MTETVNFPRDSTLRELVAVQRAQLLASGSADAIDYYYNALARQITDKKMMDALFCEWWGVNWTPGTSTYNNMLARWFGNVLQDDRIHGVRFPLFSTSTSPEGVLTDDSTGLVCIPSTEAEANRDDFAALPQFWCVEVAAEKNTDGTHTIYACEYIDDIRLVRQSSHLTWVLQKNTYTSEYNEGGYRVLKMRCYGGAGYNTWPQGTDRAGTVYPYIGNPKYMAGLNPDGTVTCASGLPPTNYISHNQGVTLWRQRGTQYSGASGCLLKWQLRMVWLKYASKGNSGIIEGGVSYNYQYAAAVGETGTNRVILTNAQAANIFVGSNVIIGDKGTGTSVDRDVASMYSIAKNRRISRIEPVTVGGTTYSALYIDTDGTFDTVAGKTYISTMPYWSGWNDTVQGYDGSRYSATSGKETGLVQKTEFQIGAYITISDELWQWGQDANGDYTFDCYTCYSQSQVTTNGTISSAYTKQQDLTLTFQADIATGWKYIEDTAISEDPAVLWPAAVSTTATSSTGCRAGFYAIPVASGVRVARYCGSINAGNTAGLPACTSADVTTSLHWYSAVGTPGLSG